METVVFTVHKLMKKRTKDGVLEYLVPTRFGVYSTGRTKLTDLKLIKLTKNSTPMAILMGSFDSIIKIENSWLFVGMSDYIHFHF